MSVPGKGLTRGNIGAHSITGADERVLRCIVRGTIHEAEALALREITFEHGELHGAYPFVLDVRAMGGMESRARMAFVKVDRPYPFTPCVIVGASFGIRTAMQGMFRAGRVLLPKLFTWQLVIAASDADLEKILAEDARRHGKK